MSVHAKNAEQNAYTVLRLQRDILKVAVADWIDTPTPAHCPVAFRDFDGCLDYCIQLATLLELFGSECYTKVQLEAYLWTQETKQILSQIGWLEGGIVVVDMHRRRVTLPHVDQPSASLRLPMIWPGRSEYAGLKCAMSWAEFSSAWNEAIGRFRTFPGARFSERESALLADAVYDWAEDAPELEAIWSKVANRALGLVSLLFPKQSQTETSSVRDLCKQAVLRHLSALVENEHLKSLRLEPKSFRDRTEFLKFFGNGAFVSDFESRTRTLFVPDGEVTLLLLQQLLTDRTTPGGNGYELSDIDLRDLQLNQRPRLSRFSNWLRRILSPSEHPADEHFDYREMLGGPTWSWLGAIRSNSDKCSRALNALNRFESHPSSDSLKALCLTLGLPAFTSAGDFQALSPIACPIHLYLRRTEITDRALIAFPLIGWSNDKRPDALRNLFVYFVGTMDGAVESALEENVENVRSIVSTCAWPTVARLLDREDEAIRQTTNMFGHDLKNRLGETAFYKRIGLLREYSRNPQITDGPAKMLIAQLETLYGTVELFRSINKIVEGALPTSWLDTEWVHRFPFKSAAEEAVSLDQVERAMESLLIHLGQCYAEQIDRPLRLRRLSGESIVKDVLLRDLVVDPSEIGFAPIDCANRGAVFGILAGLAELARNAFKAVCKEEEQCFIENHYGSLYVNYEIVREGHRVGVRIWNPVGKGRQRGDGNLGGASIEQLKSMYRQISAVEMFSASGRILRDERGAERTFAVGEFYLAPRNLTFH